MRKFGPAGLLYLAVIFSGWFLFAELRQSITPPVQAVDLPRRSDSYEIEPSAIDGTVGGTTVADDPTTAISDRSGDSARSWPVAPEIMESSILHELAALADSGISSIVSWSCTQTLCEIRVISGSMLSALVGPESPFSRKFSQDPYRAIIRARSRMFALGAWDQTILLASNGSAIENLAGEWRHGIKMSRRTADTLLSGFLPGSSPLSLGHTAEGVQLVGQNICSDNCSKDTRRVIYLVVPEGRTCAELDGTEWVTMALSDSAARDGSGEVRQRTFCLPNSLREY